MNLHAVPESRIGHGIIMNEHVRLSFLLDPCASVFPEKSSSLELEKIRLLSSDSYFFPVISIDLSPVGPKGIAET